MFVSVHFCGTAGILVNYRAVPVWCFPPTGRAMGLERATSCHRLLILEVGIREPRRRGSRTHVKGERYALRCPMVSMYCPVCHISSPRDFHELVHARPFCAVCGASLNKGLVEEAVSRYTALKQAEKQTNDGDPQRS